MRSQRVALDKAAVEPAVAVSERERAADSERAAEVLGRLEGLRGSTQDAWLAVHVAREVDRQVALAFDKVAEDAEDIPRGVLRRAVDSNILAPVAFSA